jgi:hypothetical protein
MTEAMTEAMIEARTAAKLEGGTISPSVATPRRYAEATGRRLKIGFI